MTEQNILEMIKSFAYGITAEAVAENEEIPLSTAAAFQAEHTAEIEEKRTQLREAGYINE